MSYQHRNFRLKHLASAYRCDPAALGGVGPAMDIMLNQYADAELFGYGGADGSEVIRYTNDGEPTAVASMNGRAKAAYIAANNTVWPNLHEMGAKWAVRCDGDMALYDELNSNVAVPIAKALEGVEYAHLLNNDYQFGLVPYHVRRLYTGKMLLISHFVHTPWPHRETVPENCRDFLDMVAEGMLSSDFIGFHTTRWMDNFMSYVRDAFADKYRIDLSGEVPYVHGQSRHYSALIVQPLGIRSQRWQQHAVGELTVRRFQNMDIVLGVERNDYTKCVNERFQACQLFFREHPEEIGKTVFFQIAAPTRKDVDSFKLVWAECEMLEAEILEEFRGRSSNPDWVPLYWEKKDGGLKPEELGPLYRRARVIAVNPQMDGLNLVAKEATICQSSNDPGVLCLSRGAGVWDELGDHVVELDPHDPSQMARQIYHALREVPLTERIIRNSEMKKIIRANPLENWLEVFSSLAHAKALQLRQSGRIA